MRVVRMPYLQQVKGRWRVRVVVPPELVPIVGKRSLIRSTGSGDRSEANRRAAPIIAEFLAAIAEAKAKREPKFFHYIEEDYRTWRSSQIAGLGARMMNVLRAHKLGTSKNRVFCGG